MVYTGKRPDNCFTITDRIVSESESRTELMAAVGNLRGVKTLITAKRKPRILNRGYQGLIRCFRIGIKLFFRNADRNLA